MSLDYAMSVRGEGVTTGCLLHSLALNNSGSRQGASLFLSIVSALKIRSPPKIAIRGHKHTFFFVFGLVFGITRVAVSYD
eukprot:2474825-Amphidinium_carterae.1